MEGHHKGRQGAGERWRAIIKEDKEQGREMEGHHKGRQGAGKRLRAIIKEDKEQGRDGGPS